MWFLGRVEGRRVGPTVWSLAFVATNGKETGGPKMWVFPCGTDRSNRIGIPGLRSLREFGRKNGGDFYQDVRFQIKGEIFDRI
jgi:hypothetical protein